jgi:hypothetical protein
MAFASPPPTAAWEHRGSRRGFEVAFIRPLEGGLRLEARRTWMGAWTSPTLSGTLTTP